MLPASAIFWTDASSVDHGSVDHGSVDHGSVDHGSVGHGKKPSNVASTETGSANSEQFQIFPKFYWVDSPCFSHCIS